MILSEVDILYASRKELEKYLESWGFQVYEDETDDQLREAVMENFRTENR